MIGFFIGLGLVIWAGRLALQGGSARFLPPEVALGTVTLISPTQAGVLLVATGYVYSQHRATIAPKMVGRVVRLKVKEGDSVKAGQVLAELDATEAEMQFAQLRAELAVSRARLEGTRVELNDAERKAQRVTTLLNSGAGTQAAAEDAASQAASVRARLATAEAELGAVQARTQTALVALDNTKISAPFNGTVIRRLCEVGEIVSPSSGIIILASLNDLEVQADVAETNLSRVQVGMPAEVVLDAFPDHRYRARVEELRQTVDRAKAAVTVKLRFVDPTPAVLPDMAAKVSFLSQPLDGAAVKVAPKLAVPFDAVVERGGRSVLFAVTEGKVHELPAMPGARMADLIELLDGPAAGTRVVRNPPSSLHEGAAVKEKE